MLFYVSICWNPHGKQSRINPVFAAVCVCVQALSAIKLERWEVHPFLTFCNRLHMCVHTLPWQLSFCSFFQFWMFSHAIIIKVAQTFLQVVYAEDAHHYFSWSSAHPLHCFVAFLKNDFCFCIYELIHLACFHCEFLLKQAEKLADLLILEFSYFMSPSQDSPLPSPVQQSKNRRESFPYQILVLFLHTLSAPSCPSVKPYVLLGASSRSGGKVLY